MHESAGGARLLRTIRRLFLAGLLVVAWAGAAGAESQDLEGPGEPPLPELAESADAQPIPDYTHPARPAPPAATPSPYGFSRHELVGTGTAATTLRFHNTRGCTISRAIKNSVTNGYRMVYGQNGRATTELFRRNLARQLFDQDLLNGVDGCKPSSRSDLVSHPRDWSYARSRHWDGLNYWDSYLENGGTFPAVRNQATRFTNYTWSNATAADVLYALSNTAYNVDFYCTKERGDRDTMSATPLPATSGERYYLGDRSSTDDHWNASTLLHEAMHNRHFDHSCGRPSIAARTAENFIDTSADKAGWHNQQYASTTPPKAVEINAWGAVMPVTLMSRWTPHIHQTGLRRPRYPADHETGPYPNGWKNYQLLKFKGYEAVRLFFGKVSTEARYDEVQVMDSSGKVQATYSGELRDFWTPWIEDDQVTIAFRSDRSLPTECSQDDDCPSRIGFGFCNLTRHLCQDRRNGDRSFMGYEIITYEGRGPNNEGLVDLYRDSVAEAHQNGWDTLTTYIRTNRVPNRTISSPNYLPAYERSPWYVGMGEPLGTRYGELQLHGKLNDASDTDVFRLWTARGEDDWTQDAAEYTAEVSVLSSNGPLDCRITRVDDAADSTGTVVTREIGNSWCELSAGLPTLETGQDPDASYPRYYLSIDRHPANTATIVDYGISTTTRVRCMDDGESNRSIAAAQKLSSYSPLRGRAACQLKPKFFSFTYRSAGTGVGVLFDNGEQGDLDVRLLDATGKVLMTSVSTTDDEVFSPHELTRLPLVDGATYYLEVYGYIPAGNSATTRRMFSFDVMVEYADDLGYSDWPAIAEDPLWGYPNHIPSLESGSCGGGGPELVYVLWVPTKDDYTITTERSQYDTVVYVRDAAGNELGCNDNAGSRTSKLSLTLEPQEPYLVFVDGKEKWDAGPMSLAVDYK